MTGEKTCTLEDLEEAKSQIDIWGDSGRHNNPGRTRRYNVRKHEEEAPIKERIAYIRNRLIAQGDLEAPVVSPLELERGRYNMELDKLYPNAKSKSIVEFEGKRYQRRNYPLSTSRSGKTVTAWSGRWELLS